MNLRDVKHLSSAQLGRLITLGRMVREKGGRLILYNVHPSLREIFTIIHVDTMLDIRYQEPPNGQVS